MNKELKFKDGWEIVPSDSKTGLFMQENWMYNEGQAKQEQDILHDMLKLFIPGEYGYYFCEVHDSPRPKDIPEFTEGVWKNVYYTPAAFYYKSGEYNIITTTSTEDYAYYAISLHGCSFASALTEFARVAK